MKAYNINNDWDWVIHFENEIAKYSGAPHAIACDSNSNAIKLVLEYLNIKDKEIQIPKNTYASVPMQIIHSGNIPVFIDLEWQGEYQLQPYPIWDSATRFRKNMYKQNTFQILSFHLKKILNIGTGGMILTSDTDFIKWARPMIYDGRDFTKMYVDDEFQCIGYHMYMTPEQAKRGLEIFHSEKIKDMNEDCGSSKTYKDLTLQKIFKKS
jgi:dTDP-4-amino-4,6-dideoxygalactose transaminase